MSWMGWVAIGIISMNVLLFGTMYIWFIIDRKEKK